MKTYQSVNPSQLGNTLTLMGVRGKSNNWLCHGLDQSNLYLKRDVKSNTQVIQKFWVLASSDRFPLELSGDRSFRIAIALPPPTRQTPNPTAFQVSGKVAIATQVSDRTYRLLV